MELAAVALVLIFNGTEVDLAHPVLAVQGDLGTQQVLVPVRNVFEAAGFAVQYRAGDDPHVSITGYVDRLPERQLVRHGSVYLRRPQIRCEEYVATLPAAPERRDDTLYIPAIALRIIAGGELTADLEEKTLRWELPGPEEAPTLEIGELVANLPRWLHQRVRVEGTVVEAEGDPRHPATALGAPAPGAWVVADGTGALYCTDTLWTKRRLVVPDPGVEFAQRVALSGVVRPGWGGVPYLSQVLVEPTP
ncbi:MAG: hypothetical protein U9R79_16415 [Armatimonadota bacterium]|nr:hypothetical protein [Armatimonadota bacterium]